MKSFWLLFRGFIPALLLPLILSYPVVLQSEVVQASLRLFYALFDPRVESNLKSLDFYEFARLTLAVEWMLIPVQVALFLRVFKTAPESTYAFPRLASMGFWKSFMLVHFVGISVLWAFASPIFHRPEGPGGIGTPFLELMYSGKLGFLVMFSLMSWGFGMLIAVLLGYWRWVVYRRLFGR